MFLLRNSDVGFSSVSCEYVYYHCLIKKLLWPMAGQNRARQENSLNAGIKKAKSGKCHVVRGQNLTGRPQPHG